MSWHDSTSPWQKQLKLQSNTLIFIGLFFAIFALVLFEISYLWKFGLFALFCLILLLLLIKSSRRYKRIRQEVPKSEGSLCPWCLIQLADEPIHPACPKCNKRFDPVELQRYWIRYAFDKQNAIALKTLAYATPNGVQRVRRKLRLIALKNFVLSHGILGFQLYIFFSLIIGMTFILKNQSLLQNTLRAFQGTGFFIALTLYVTTLSSSSREGLTKCCFKCEFIHPPDGTFSENCPECGSKWLEPGDYQIGIKREPKPQLYIAIGILVLWCIVILTTVDIPAFIQKVMQVL